MIEAINNFWGLVVIVSTVVVLFFRFSGHLIAVFKTVRNQKKVNTNIESLVGELATIKAAIQGIQFLDENASRERARLEKELARLEKENDAQWELIRDVEKRMFDLINNR